MKKLLLVARVSFAGLAVEPIASASTTGKREIKGKAKFTRALTNAVLEKGGPITNDSPPTTQSFRGCRQPP
jgi:hypothetical protein